MDYSTLLDERIDAVEIEKLRQVYEKQCARGEASAIATFNFAHALIGSRNKQEVREGIRLFESLLKDELSDGRRDYIFYLAVANARLKDYPRAIAYIDVLLNSEKTNMQAIDLKMTIEKKLRNDGLFGAAVVGVGVAVIGGVVAALLTRK